MKIPRIITEKVVREIADKSYAGISGTNELLAIIAILLIEIRDKD